MNGLRIEISLFSIVILSLFSFPALAEENSVNELSVLVETDKAEYEIGDSLTISGFVEEKKMPLIALRIYDPDGRIVSANQVEIEEDSTFSKKIILDSSLYEKTGKYSISLDYGKIKVESSFDLISETYEEITEDLAEKFEFPEVLVITDKETYQDGDTITVAGFVSEIKEPTVLIGIYDPFGFPAGFYFGEIDSNFEFSVNFLVKDGVNFKTEGEYSVIARYGDSKDKITFSYIEKQEKLHDTTKTYLKNDSSEENSEPLVKKNVQKEKKTTTQVEKIVKEQVPKNTFELKTPKAPSEPLDNLSVKDLELGKILNRINLECDSSEYDDIISYYDSMGPALIRLCKFNNAISYYDRTLIENPNNIDALNNKGSALSKMGYYDEAITFYDYAVDIDSENFLSLNNKANALASLGNYQEAITTYNEALLYAPENTIILNNLEKAEEKLSTASPQKDEIKLQLVENTPKVSNDIKNNEQNPNFLEQIRMAFSSIGDALFGFLS